MTDVRGPKWLALCLGRAESDLFPWQRALLARFERGEVPDLLDLPTGMGKTSVMAIWLVARALGASVPRRLVYVVDRRAVVDQATEVAKKLRERVETTPELREALALRRPLPISTLRGQFADDREWRRDPASVAIVVGTVDMIGSRVLFQGYGVSRKMRSFHAALLGVDALFVLDEAHLSQPFHGTMSDVASLGQRAHDVVPPLRVMAMSATSASGGAFGLGEDDSRHEVVRERLNAVKRVRVLPAVAPSELASALAEQAREITSASPCRVIVYCRKRRDAEKVERLLAKADVERELLVGARRVRERDLVGRWLDANGFLASRERTPAERSAVLIATSAGEVGVDLDADHMVGDLVPWERMVQRLGRVNRFGKGRADVLLVGTSESKSPQPEENEEFVRLEKVGQVLQLLPEKDETRDASPAALLALKARASSEPAVRELLDAATTKAPLRPPASRAVVESWTMTSLDEHPGRPDVEPWLRGWTEDEDPKTIVVWRENLPVRSWTDVPKREVEAFFEAAPPHLTEELETETYAVQDWLLERAKAQPADSTILGTEEEGSDRPRDEDPVAFMLSRNGDLRRRFTLHQLRNASKEDLDQLKNGVLIVDARLGGLGAQGLLDPDVSDPPRTADDPEGWIPGKSAKESPTGFHVHIASEDEEKEKRRGAKGPWKERYRFECDPLEKDDRRVIVVDRLLADPSEEDDVSSSEAETLDVHQRKVEKAAATLADRVGLRGDVKSLLLAAARWHDQGKEVGRWQRAFGAPCDGKVYAKTTGRINQWRLAGYRHELGSVIRAKEQPDVRDLSEVQRDLVLHLIASHHGRARPTLDTRGCDDPVDLDREREEISLRFARVQEAWGPWGLAWLELLLRSADHEASADAGEPEVEHG